MISIEIEYLKTAVLPETRLISNPVSNLALSNGLFIKGVKSSRGCFDIGIITS